MCASNPPDEVPDVPDEVPDDVPDVPDDVPEVPEVPDEVPEVPDEVPEVPDEVPDVPDEVPDEPDDVPDVAFGPMPTLATPLLVPTPTPMPVPPLVALPPTFTPTAATPVCEPTPDPLPTDALAVTPLSPSAFTPTFRPPVLPFPTDTLPSPPNPTVTARAGVCRPDQVPPATIVINTAEAAAAFAETDFAIFFQPQEVVSRGRLRRLERPTIDARSAFNAPPSRHNFSRRSDAHPGSEAKLTD